MATGSVFNFGGGCTLYDHQWRSAFSLLLPCFKRDRSESTQSTAAAVLLDEKLTFVSPVYSHNSVSPAWRKEREIVCMCVCVCSDARICVGVRQREKKILCVF